MEKDQAYHDIKNCVANLKPDWKIKDDKCGCGHGFVDESAFTFSKCSNLWIVYLCETRDFAFKEVDCEWIESFSNLILESPQVFVEFDINHHITAWTAIQEKKCPCEER